MGDKAPTSTTQSTTPWTSSQPYLKDIMGQAQSNFNSGVGQTYYPGQTVADFSDQSKQGLDATSQIATAGNSTSAAATGAANGILANPLTGGQQNALGILGNVASGANKINTGGQYQGMLDGIGGTSSAANLAGLADKNNVGQLGSDYLKGQQFATDQASEQLKRSLSGMGGLGGNAATAQAFASQIGGQNAQQNAQELARQQQMMLSANGQIDASNNANVASRLGVLNGLTGTQGQNISNQMNAANYGFAGEQQGTSNAMGVMSMLPTLDASRYYDANKMLGVGDAYDQKNQQMIAAGVDKYNFENSAPTNALGNYLNTISGATGNYSNQKVTTPGGSVLGGILGGAVGGATAGSALGPWGAGIGGILGGIGGGFA